VFDLEGQSDALNCLHAQNFHHSQLAAAHSHHYKSILVEKSSAGEGFSLGGFESSHPMPCSCVKQQNDLEIDN